jgi:hypothetical protein
MQRNAMLMYTSCGWFFDDICGIEAVQIMQHAARAIQLAKETDGSDFESGFESILENAPTNVKEFADGKQAYEALVKPTNVDLNRVGAHLAVSSIFEQYADRIDIYCYSANIERYDRVDAGIQTLAVGRATVQSNIVLEKHPVDFAVLHFGDHNLIGAVNSRASDDSFALMQENLTNAFATGNTTEIIRLMNIYFSGNNYSLWHLFKDQQRRILYELLETTWQEIEAAFRHIYEHNYTIMNIMRGMDIPLPKALSAPAEFVINQDLRRFIEDDKSDLDEIKKLANEAAKLSLQLDDAMLRYEASRRINRLMGRLENSPEDTDLLERIESTMRTLLTVTSELDLQKAQNVFFGIGRQTYPLMCRKADSADTVATKWIQHFKNLAQFLDVEVG